MVLVCQECTTRYAPDLEQCPHCGSVASVGEDEVRPRRLLPARVVACGTKTCPVRGVVRRVGARHAAPGVLERPVLVCARCGGEMQPVDNDGDEEQEEESMPKITVHGGASNADDPDAQPAEEPAQAEQPTTEAGQSEEPAAPTAEDYNDWTVTQLRAELAERGLSTTGNKADLQQRLADG
jgi:hypothetical protein